MAEPQREIPDSATNREPDRPEDGEAALRAALAEHGGEYADAIDHTDELDDLLTTAILVVASADEEDVDRVTDSLVALTNAGDALSTDQTVALAEGIGENGDELAETLDTVVRLQREGHLDTFVALAEALSESLSPAETDRLAQTIRENGDEFAGALDSVLELERKDVLDDLVDTATTLSKLDLDEDAVAGMNRFMAAIGEAERETRRESQSVGVVGLVRSLGSDDVRGGLGYLVALLKAQGKRLRND